VTQTHYRILHNIKYFIGKEGILTYNIEIILAKRTYLNGGKYMAKSGKKILNLTKYVLILSIIIGALFGVIFSAVTRQWASLPFFVLSGAVTALIVKLFADISIKRLANNFAGEMETIKQGDFSILVESKNYGILGRVSSTVNSVLSDIRALIDGFFSLSGSIVQASRKMSATAQETAAAIKEISKTIDEIAKGASTQAHDAQQGVHMVEKLSEQINIVYKTYSDVTTQTSKINDLNTIGLDSVLTLKEKSEENFKTSEKIFSVVEKLTNSTKDIGLFVESIENIAEQTNLLALNAAIEAARAGEAGRGFAVVAEEVRKLADESRKSTEEITNLMQSIQEESHMAIEAMEIMKKVSQEQSIAVNRTNYAFNDIANGMNSIIEKIKEVNASVSKMQHDKDEVISAIENISSVSQQTAASSEEVAATTEQQLKAIDDMKSAAKALDELVHELDAKLKKYKLR